MWRIIPNKSGIKLKCCIAFNYETNQQAKVSIHNQGYMLNYLFERIVINGAYFVFDNSMKLPCEIHLFHTITISFEIALVQQYL